MKNADLTSNLSAPSTSASADTVTTFVATAHPVDVADWLEQLPRSEAWAHIASMAAARRATVFAHLSLEAQTDLARMVLPQALAEIVTQMDTDDRADLFNLLTPVEQHRLAQHLADEECENIRSLSAHDADTAGAIMTTDYAILGADMTTQEAIAELRRQAPDTETIYRSHILDGTGSPDRFLAAA